MRYRPLVWIAAAFAAGILAAGEHPFLLWILAPLFPVLLLVSVITKRNFWGAAAGLVGLALLGFCRYNAAVTMAPNDVARLAPAALTVTGVVVSDVDSAGKSANGQPEAALFNLRAEQAEGGPLDRAVAVSGEISVHLPLGSKSEAAPAERHEIPHYGDTLVLHGTLARPDSVRNPGAFDRRENLARRGIHASLFVPRPEDARALPENAGNPFLQFVFGLRQRILAYGRTSLPVPNGAVLNGILLGDRSDLPPDLREAFESTGTAHILATAGLHIGIALWLLLTLLRGLKVGKRPAHCFAIAALLLFAFMAGGRPSVMRAALVACLFLLGPLLAREPDWWTITALAALILLLYNPCSLFDPGFQLSFVTVITLVLLMPFFAPFVNRIRNQPEGREPVFSFARELKTYLAACFALSLAAWLATWPLQVYYGYQVSLVAWCANMCIVPLVTLIFALGFSAALLFGIAPVLTAPFDVLLNALLTVIVLLVHFWAGQTWGMVNAAPPPVWFLWLYYGALWTTAYHLEKQAKARDRKAVP